jgi:hypothetical protein
MPTRIAKLVVVGTHRPIHLFSLAVGILAGLDYVGASAATQADDVTVMLAVRSFTLAKSGPAEVLHQAAVNMRDKGLSMVSADLQDLDKMSLAPTPWHNETHKVVLDSSNSTLAAKERALEGIRHAMLKWGGIGSVLLVALVAACFCAFCYGLFSQPGRGQASGRGATSGQPRRALDQHIVQKEVWRKHDSEEKARLLALFAAIDELVQSSDNPPGHFTESDMINALQDVAIAKEFRRLDIVQQDASFVFRMLDENNSGRVSMNEFVSGCLNRVYEDE